MKIDLFNIDEFVEINGLKEITSPVLFQRGDVPDPDGLVSNEIFGVTISERKETFAYIDLHGHFFHPHIYKALKRLYRNVEKIINGTEYYIITNEGELIKDDNGETGIDFLYNNWEKIKWEKSGSGMRDERIDLLTKTKKNEIFISKQIVIPAFYRDLKSNKSGGGESSKLNTFYSNLIRLTSLLKEKDMFDFTFNNTNYNIQSTLVNIYDYFKLKLQSKNGLLRKYLMGRNVDYCTRTVISEPLFHANTPEEMFIDFSHAGIPISQACSLCFPLVVHWIKTFFDNELISQFNKSNINMLTGDIKGEPFELKNPESYFTDKFIKKKIDQYIKDPGTRFEPIEVPTTSNRKVYMVFHGNRFSFADKSEQANIVHRYMTWTDLLYMACEDVTKDKHCIITRYPVTDAYGIFTAKIRILSTCKTMQMQVGEKIYKWYPVVDLEASEQEVSTSFIDSVQFSNSFLKGICGDYDGDQVTVKVVWSMEANKECHEVMNQRAYFLNNSGDMIRVIGNEGAHTLYVLTKDSTKNNRTLNSAETSLLLKKNPNEFDFDYLVSLLGEIKNKENLGVNKPKYEPNDIVIIKPNMYKGNKEEIRTTVGRVIYNKLIVEKIGLEKSLGFMNFALSSKGNKKLEAILAKDILNEKITVDQMRKYVEVRDWIGYQLHAVISTSFTPGTTKIHPEVAKLRDELIKKYKKELDAGDNRISEMIENQLIERTKELLKDDPGMDLYVSGARGSVENNLKNITLMRGAIFNSATGKYDIVQKSLMDGIDRKDITSASNSILAGAYPKSVGTQVSGYMAKQLIACCQTEVLDDEGTDCGTLRGVPFTITEKNKNKVIHRYIMVNKKPLLLTEDNINTYVGKTVNLRSPMTCISNKICNCCAGEFDYKMG